MVVADKSHRACRVQGSLLLFSLGDGPRSPTVRARASVGRGLLICCCACRVLPDCFLWRYLPVLSTRGCTQAALQEVYGDDVELCDVLVGNLAEDKIEGFAIR